MCVFDRYLADGFDPCDPVTHRPTVYEFHGCLWHGCPKCFPLNRGRHPICHHDRTIQEVYETTFKKEETLRKRGCNVIVMWECNWDDEVKTNPELLSSSTHWTLSTRFNPETLSSGIEPMLSNCITWLIQTRKSTTLT